MPVCALSCGTETQRQCQLSKFVCKPKVFAVGFIQVGLFVCLFCWVCFWFWFVLFSCCCADCNVTENQMQFNWQYLFIFVCLMFTKVNIGLHLIMRSLQETGFFYFYISLPLEKQKQLGDTEKALNLSPWRSSVSFSCLI